MFLQWTDRTNPGQKHFEAMAELRQIAAAPLTPQLFGNAGLEHMEKYGRLLVAVTDICLSI